jgi:hypothetical protein
MKRTTVLVAALFGLGALACAQEPAGERIVVPAREDAPPRLVSASALDGSITVKSYSGKDVIVEMGGAPGAERPAPGVLQVSEEDNTIIVKLDPPAFGKLVISVPAEISLKLKTNLGPITVEGVSGEVEAESVNGEITLTGISGTVVADSTNSAIKVTMDRVDPAKPMSFSSLNGSIDVTLPRDGKAIYKWQTGDKGGYLYSKGASSGYQIRGKGSIFPGVNVKANAEISFRTLNGTIYLRWK